MYRDADGYVKLWTSLGALWEGDDNPKRPHATLSKGKHSNGFFNGGIPLANARLRHQMCEDLADKMQALDLPTRTIDSVFGPAMGAITLSGQMAHVLVERQGRDIFDGFAEKCPEGMELKRYIPVAGSRALLLEDTLTSGASSEQVAQALLRKGIQVMPWVVALLNRSGKTELYGRKVIALVDRYMPLWDPAECPRCKTGSEAIPAKTPASNWQRLNAEY